MKKLLTLFTLAILSAFSVVAEAAIVVDLDQAVDSGKVVTICVGGKYLYGSNAQNCAMGDAAAAVSENNAVVGFKVEKEDSCYLFRAVTPKGGDYGLWGRNPCYLNASPSAIGVIFILGKDQDFTGGSSWKVENGALKNVGNGAYFNGESISETPVQVSIISIDELKTMATPALATVNVDDASKIKFVNEDREELALINGAQKFDAGLYMIASDVAGYMLNSVKINGEVKDPVAGAAYWMVELAKGDVLDITANYEEEAYAIIINDLAAVKSVTTSYCGGVDITEQVFPAAFDEDDNVIAFAWVAPAGFFVEIALNEGYAATLDRELVSGTTFGFYATEDHEIMVEKLAGIELTSYDLDANGGKLVFAETVTFEGKEQEVTCYVTDVETKIIATKATLSFDWNNWNVINVTFADKLEKGTYTLDIPANKIIGCDTGNVYLGGQILFTIASGDTTVVERPDYSLIPDVLYIENAEAKVGETALLPIVLNNSEPVCALQFDLYLPEGITVDNIPDYGYYFELNNRMNYDNFAVNSTYRKEDGCYRVAVTSPQNAMIEAGAGVALLVNLVIADYVEAGVKSIYVRNQNLSHPDATSAKYEESVCELTVTDYTLGDVNSDGEIDINDYVATVNIILEKNNYLDFNRKAADVNQDGNVNSGDCVGIINYVLYNSFTNAKDSSMFKAPARNGGVAVSVSDLAIKAGETAEMVVSLDNPFADYTSMQFDLNLPAGLNVVSAKWADRTDNRRHSLMSNKLGNGSVRFLGVSGTNKAFEGSNGALMTITLQADNSFETGSEVELSNISLAQTNTAVTYVDNMVVKTNETTGIADVENGKCKVENGKLYNLTGQRVSKNAKGVLIVNGKKAVRK